VATTSWSSATISAATDVSASTHLCVLVTSTSWTESASVLTVLATRIRLPPGS
jgi:hypothetical protein